MLFRSRILLDTNILISALLTKHTPPYSLYQSWIKGQFQLLTSHSQINELKRVLQYERIQRFVNPSEAQKLVDAIQSEAVFIHIFNEVHFSTDPSDNVILSAAIAGKADYIVTGDKKDLLLLQCVENIPIVTSREAVDTLTQSDVEKI